jgi:hypothetical protein
MARRRALPHPPREPIPRPLGSAEAGPLWESGKLGRRRNREPSEQDQEWQSARPGRRQAARAMDAKWRGKGLTLPLPVIYRSSGAMPPETPRVAPIKCRQHHQPLASEPHHAETVVHTRVRDHYGAVTEGSRCPVTSPPPYVAHYVCATPPEKARPLRTTAATTAII